MNKIAFCLSGVLVIVCFSWIILLSLISNMGQFYGYTTFPFYLSLIGTGIGLYLCRFFYKKEN